MGNVHMEAKDINYRGGQKKMSVEEALKNTSGEAAAIAQLQQDVTDLNDVKANKITIAPTFSAEASYDPGDLVYYNGLTYRCVNAHEGEWDADDFAATTIDGELAELRSGLTDVNSKVDGVVDNISVSGVYFMKVGRMVFMQVSAWKECFTMPAKYRPLVDAYFAVRSSQQGSGNDIVTHLIISSTGTMVLGTNDTFVGALSWIAGNLD